MRKRYRCIVIYIAAFILMWISFSSYAETETPITFHLLNNVDEKFQPFQHTWYRDIRVYAERLFWLLVLVDFGWSATIYALEKNDITEIIVNLVKKIFSIGFFWGLLKFSDTWIPAIINSLREIGTTVGKVKPSSSTPDGIVSTGYELAKGAFMLVDKLNVFEAIAAIFPVTFIAIFIFLAFLFVAAQLLIALVESYIAIGAGVILLGFGGSQWTKDFATKYLQYATGTGLKLMLLYLIVGAGQTLFDSMTLDQNHLFETCLTALGSAVTYAFLAVQIPQIASSMMSGSPSLTAGSFAATALAGVAAATGAASITKDSASALANKGESAAANATGLGKALGAGYNSASDKGLSGMAAAKHAVGEVAKEGLGLVLDKPGDAAKGSGKSGFAGKVESSIGGKIASRIDAKRSANATSPNAKPSASSGSGTANSKTADTSKTGSSSTGNPTGSASTNSTQASTSNGGAGAESTSRAVPPPEISSSSVNNKEGGKGSTLPLHEKMSALQGYVPQDMASDATNNINSQHKAD